LNFSSIEIFLLLGDGIIPEFSPVDDNIHREHLEVFQLRSSSFHAETSFVTVKRASTYKWVKGMMICENHMVLSEVEAPRKRNFGEKQFQIRFYLPENFWRSNLIPDR